VIGAGDKDLERASRALAARLPEPLAVLARLAFNYRWSWVPGGPEVFREIDAHRWEKCGENPVRLLQEAPTHALVRAAADPDLLARAAAIEEAVAADRARPFAEGPLSPDRPAAFLCAEYGVHRSLPIYGGGLGALAGDFLKAASDRALPLVAVGLLYRKGYFLQRIDQSGWQHEYWIDTDPERLPTSLVTDANDLPVTISVSIRGREVVAQIWRIDLGRVPLFLLDAERPENSPLDRWITAQLYVRDRSTRQAQYTLLGIGGIRALHALGIEPGIVHLNEGHASLASLELVRAEVARGVDPVQALEGVRARTVFTTHTPVAAGNETYGRDEVAETLGSFPAEIGLDLESFLDLGRSRPGATDEPFGVTQLGLRVAGSANGVSRRHGEVARQMWSGLYPDRPVDEVPIGHVTNGVHLGTWLAPAMRALLAEYLGEDFETRAADPATWKAVDEIPDEELWATRNRLRAELVEFVRERSVLDRLARNEPHDYVEAAARAFDPELLTIGFARRLATYKRLHLLVVDPARAVRLVGGRNPVQVLIAGKAHPNDDEAKRIVQQLFAIKRAGSVGQRVAVLHDYDLGLAEHLVRGCDLWMNAPRPPLEASGTSGMKSAMNGGLQVSVLDGWWAEAYDGGNGWAVSGEVDADHAAQDARDADTFYRILEDQVAPEFYARDDRGLPRVWLARIRASLRSIGPAFSADRMLADYVARAYTPLLK
jgi:starch phosphorylase